MSTAGTRRPPTKAAPLIVREVDGDVIVMDVRTGEAHQLTGPAADVWRSIDGQPCTHLSDEIYDNVVSSLADLGLVELPAGFSRRVLFQRAAIVAGGVGITTLGLPMAMAAASGLNYDLYTLFVNLDNSQGASGNINGTVGQGITTDASLPPTSGATKVAFEFFSGLVVASLTQLNKIYSGNKRLTGDSVTNSIDFSDTTKVQYFSVSSLSGGNVLVHTDTTNKVYAVRYLPQATSSTVNASASVSNAPAGTVLSLYDRTSGGVIGTPTTVVNGAASVSANNITAGHQVEVVITLTSATATTINLTYSVAN